MKAWINNLKLARKFLLIGTLAAGAVGFPSVLLVLKEVALLESADGELRGIEPARATLRLLRVTQQHRGLSGGVLGGNESLVATREAKEAEVDAAAAGAQAALATFADPDLQSLVTRVHDDWKVLAADVRARAVTPAESFARHSALTATELRMLRVIADSSGIVLHPEPAGYFLQAGVLDELPRLTEALGQVRARGAAVLARGEATPEERVLVDAAVARARDHLARAQDAFTLATTGDPELASTLGPQIAATVKSTEEGLRLAEEQIVSAPPQLTYASADFFAATTAVIDEEFKLSDAGFDQLSAKLAARATAAQKELGLVAAVLGVLTGLAMWLMYTITRATTQSVGSALRLAEAVATGDLTTTIEPSGRDEVGQLVRVPGTMNGSLATMVSGVRANADGVATASAQIAQGAEDLSQRTEEQASALQETSATMEELDATVRQNAENARQANQLAQAAATVTTEGGSLMGRVVETMKQINDESKKIADIISVIDGIAFQTNILALNAAVEAARAGEHGRGFAVVASEVGNLAGRSADASKEIKRLITASVQRVEQGTDLVERAGSTMKEIVTSIQRVSGIMGEISSASTQQSSAVAQVSAAVSQMDQATQQNAALVEESAAAAGAMTSQAQSLARVVAAFKVRADEERPGTLMPAPKPPRGAGRTEPPPAGRARLTGRVAAHAAAPHEPSDEDDFAPQDRYVAPGEQPGA